METGHGEMNKYQEALELLKEYRIGEELNIVDKLNYNARLEKIIDLFQELVDIYPEYLELKARATPKKATNQRYDNVRDIGSGTCICNSRVYEYHMFCPDCGQALDWSEYEVQ